MEYKITLGEDVGCGDAVVMNHGDGKWYKVRGDEYRGESLLIVPRRHKKGETVTFLCE